MECNRDEAKRAKEIAENKFSSKDITGAKKFALKAQRLYPDLDGISQFLAILDVYVAAENKINGQLDFYGILGVSPLADDDTVRKHYRKLVLSLHPDKNKSIGADGAFKYVSEAWSFLSDKQKRSNYDQKRNIRVFKHKVPTQNGGSRPTPPNGFHNFTKSTATRTKGATPQAKGTSTSASTTNSSTDNINAATKMGPTTPTIIPSSSNKQTTSKTFWTICKRCKLQYEFARMYVNRTLLCPTCHGPFLALEIEPPITNGSNHQMVEPGHGDSANPTSSPWGRFLKTTSPGSATVAQAATMVQQAYEKVKRDREEAQAAIKKQEALRKKIAKTSAKLASKNLNSAKTQQNLDGFVTNKVTEQIGSSKDVSFNTGIKNRLMKKATMEIKKKLNEWSSEPVKDSSNHRIATLVTDVPDSDFHDFDQGRTEDCFKEGQVWAAYDDHDGMPRYYAIIHRVISVDPFKMKVCWLDSNPNNSKAFGEFRMGKHEIVLVPNYFSHKANFKKQPSGKIRVFPKKGDVCALLRNNQTHEIVEIDEYDETTGITVTPLVKVSGFKTVFHRHVNPNETRVIRENENVQFSHQIPSKLLTGQESVSAPKGCRELDPAALPGEFLIVAGDVVNGDEECSK